MRKLSMYYFQDKAQGAERRRQYIQYGEEVSTSQRSHGCHTC